MKYELNNLFDFCFWPLRGWTSTQPAHERVATERGRHEKRKEKETPRTGRRKRRRGEAGARFFFRLFIFGVY